MERETSVEIAKEIMGSNFIGISELLTIEKKMGIFIPENIIKNVPSINFSEELLEKSKNDYLLILGIPFYKDKANLTIVKMREHFGWDPSISEPCFYNQDWYINESFANQTTFRLNWFLVKKSVYEEFRGKEPVEILKETNNDFPSALLLIYTFFANYLFNNEIIWKNDYIWCKDKDTSGDQIYIGKYIDIQGKNKNGFEVHRHLKIKNNYSFVEVR